MRIIDAENFDVFYFTIPDGVDADSFGIGVEYVLEEIIVNIVLIIRVMVEVVYVIVY